MLSKLITRKGSFLKNKLEESKILFTYRYLSLVITSIFYLINKPDHTLGRKLFIIGCVSIAAVILSYLYPIYEKSDKNIKLLLIIETIGNSMLLIPSGGINSPFIWYTLNTILISSIFLKKRYCWLNFLAYLLSYGIIIKFGTDIELDIGKFIKDESNLLLSFVMIIAAVQTWTIFINKTKEESRRLEEVNLQLESANDFIIESIDHIKALYQSVSILANQGNKEGIIRLSFEHIKKITKTNTVFYYDITDKNNKMVSFGNHYLIKSLEENIVKDIKNILEYKTPKEIRILSSRFIIFPVSSNYSAYGILGLEETDSKESIVYRNNIYQLQFLSELISNSFERLSLEEINERLLITEEQNRIANEIHDGVLQRLFSMSCGVFTLIKKLDSYSSSEIEKELNLIRRTTDSAMKELRDKIYGLSWKKSGSNSFNLDIKRYIDDIRKLNNINIPFSILGNVETLSTNQKKALYRMICEGIGNAVRHGKAKNIVVTLNISSEITNLSIIDDGVGFDLQRTKDDNTNGLGISNLYQLTEILHGELEIKSNIGIGTTIKVILPNNMELSRGEAAI